MTTPNLDIFINTPNFDPEKRAKTSLDRVVPASFLPGEMIAASLVKETREQAMLLINKKIEEANREALKTNTLQILTPTEISPKPSRNPFALFFNKGEKTAAVKNNEEQKQVSKKNP